MSKESVQEPVKLTSYTTKGGCGCKIGPADLSQVLRNLPASTPSPNLLVGLDTSDDAGVYRLTDDLALVQTVDFFTPIVNNPYDFGAIAATNALSDIYAMGGTPLTVLNIVAFPISVIGADTLADILRGAADKVAEAGATLVGGHSIDDAEPKFGLAVTGTIHPAHIRTNAAAQIGDQLILTKPIGIGIMTTSLKNDQLSAEEITAITAIMTTLNRTAAAIADHYDVHASTDVTGFGLLGHSYEMASGSGVGLKIAYEDVPVVPRALALAEDGFIPGGSKNNYRHLEARDGVEYAEYLTQTQRYLLCDAVTSGGLLFAVNNADSAAMLAELHAAGLTEARIIGECVAEHPGKIEIV
jgi:selenide,water dikinase